MAMKIVRLSWGELNLQEADLKMAHLDRANLRQANLKMTYLGWANLNGADLSKSDLSRARLGGTNLSGAYLTCADLRDVKFQAISNWEGIENIKLANVSGVTNAPEGFLERAMVNGAVSLESDEEWEEEVRRNLAGTPEEEQAKRSWVAGGVFSRT